MDRYVEFCLPAGVYLAVRIDRGIGYTVYGKLICALLQHAFHADILPRTVIHRAVDRFQTKSFFSTFHVGRGKAEIDLPKDGKVDIQREIRIAAEFIRGFEPGFSQRFGCCRFSGVDHGGRGRNPPADRKFVVAETGIAIGNRRGFSQKRERFRFVGEELSS